MQALVLALFGMALYAMTLGYDFTVDDAIVITDNDLVQQGPGAIGEIFSHDTFYGFFGDDAKANLVAGGRYRPLTLAMFSIEQSIAPGPFIGHLFNVLWYGGLLALLTFALREIIGNRYVWWLVPLAVALFAAHPVHTEAVANIKGRDEIVALFFAVAATWLTWRAARDDSFLGAAAGAVCMGLGCLAKETAFTFLAVIPAVLLLFPPTKQGEVATGVPWKSLKYFAPVLAAALVYLALRAAILPPAGDAPILELMNNPFVEWTGTVWREVRPLERVATGCYTLLIYLKLCFWPHPLIHDYYPTAIALRSFGDVGPWLGLLLHIGLAIVAFVSRQRHPLLALGILIYLAGISVGSNVFFSIGTLLSERFLFFPSLGWSLAIAYLIYAASQKWSPAIRYVGVGLVAIFAILTGLRNPDWRDNYTLFTTDVEKQPDSAKLQNAAAGAKTDYYQALPETQKATNKNLLTEAVAHIDAATTIHPTYRNAYLIRGNAKLLLERYDEAIADYKQTLALDPDYQPAEDNLFIALNAAGRTAGEQRGDIDGAFKYLEEAERMRPNDYETLRLLGVASGVSGRNDRALGYFERAAAARPNDADAVWNYGTALYNAGRVEDAQVEFGRARQLRPSIARERGVE